MDKKTFCFLCSAVLITLMALVLVRQKPPEATEEAISVEAEESFSEPMELPLEAIPDSAEVKNNLPTVSEMTETVRETVRISPDTDSSNREAQSIQPADEEEPTAEETREKEIPDGGAWENELGLETI